MHTPSTYHPREQSKSSSLEFDIPTPSTSRFPISSIRPEAPQNCSANPPINPPKLVYPRYDPLYILSRSSTPTPQVLSVSSYAHISPPPAPSVAPGVLADGVLTAMLPDVKDFLAEAAIAPPACPPLPTDNRVLALAALSVFYSPLHPAHWVFWNKEQKKITAAVVQSVLDTIPSPIISPIGWIAIPENLWILSSMQHAYASRLTTLPWYAAYVSTEPENRMNLRKRKPPPIMTPDSARRIGQGTASGEETTDEDEAITPPPRKRAKTRRAAASRRQTSASAQASADHTSRDIEHTTLDAEPRHEQMQCSVAEAQEQVDLVKSQDQIGDLLLLSPVDPSVSAQPSALTVAEKQEIMDGTVCDGVPSELLDATEDIPEVRKSSRKRTNRTSPLTVIPSSVSGSASRVKASTTATASPISVASTLTPQIRVRGLSTPLSRQSPSSSAGSSTVVGLCDEEVECANKLTFTEAVAVTVLATEGVAEAEEQIEELPAKGAKRSRAKTARGSRGSRTSPKAAKEKGENATASEEGRKTDGKLPARPKARAKTRRR
ncbi:hypothetical protein J3A83DRAFT_2698051 [Scleroderma citrinum]